MSHAHVIELWPSMSDFAADIGQSYNTVKAMKRRGSIPPEHWPLIVASARRRGIEQVSYELLARLVAEKRSASVRERAEAVQ